MREETIILEGVEGLNISTTDCTPFRYITKIAKQPKAVDIEAKRRPDAAPAIMVSISYFCELKREIFSTAKALM